MVNVLIVEESRIARIAIRAKVASFPDYSIATAIENAANADLICSGGKIDLVLMNVRTAEDTSGMEAASRIKAAFPRIKIILMTSTSEHSLLGKARRCGCDSFWYTEHEDMSLYEICTRTMEGEHIWPDTSPVVMIGQARSSEFTERELTVIRGLVRGDRYEDLADSMHLSINTVKYHVKNILQKTGFRTTNQLVAAVVDKRFILPNY